MTQNFTIVVKDTNDQPTDIIANRLLTVAENSDLGTTIVVFSAIDEDAGQTHRFYISDVSAYGYDRYEEYRIPLVKRFLYFYPLVKIFLYFLSYCYFYEILKCL